MSPNPKKTRQVMIRVTDEEHAQLAAAAETTRRTVASFIAFAAVTTARDVMSLPDKEDSDNENV